MPMSKIWIHLLLLLPILLLKYGITGVVSRVARAHRCTCMAKSRSFWQHFVYSHKMYRPTLSYRSTETQKLWSLYPCSFGKVGTAASSQGSNPNADEILAQSQVEVGARLWSCLEKCGAGWASRQRNLKCSLVGDPRGKCRTSLLIL